MNRLQDAISPYLLQHAQNPVQWWPWSAEALDSARREDKPILLSIGYAACHWCHVMARESFEDESTAQLMNREFVNIKVDCEQRPDLDRVYQQAHQVLTDRAGGWPLTVFLDPHTQLPFFAGTYFAPGSRDGMPGFTELLQRVVRQWRERREEVTTQTEGLNEYLQSIAATQANIDQLESAPADKAFDALQRQYDEAHGGFGSAPKFPKPAALRFLMEWSAFAPERRLQADDMVQNTLTRMAAGGIHDQLAGGFFRFSVDAGWGVPHFEKMASDNAQLLWLYAHAAKRWKRDDFAQTAIALGNWVMNNLQDSGGGYQCSWDADSEGEEGRYYVWTRDQLEAALSAPELQLVGSYWGLDREPNFDARAWNLLQARSLDEVAEEQGVGRSLARDCVFNARKKLIQARAERVPPLRDDKILTAWNGLMIGAMASAARLLEQPQMLRSAHRAVANVQTRMWQNNRLLACARGDRAELTGFLDDYAFMLDGLMELLCCAWRPSDLAFARVLGESLLVHFQDQQQGGFFFTSHDHEPLIQRQKPMRDDALPAGNAVAARALLRLGRLLSEPVWEQTAELALRNAISDLDRIPHSCCAMLGVLDDVLHPPRQLVVRGGRSEVRDLWNALAGRLDVRDTVFALDSSSLLSKFPVAGPFTAHLCAGNQCSSAMTSATEVLEQID